ncbi:hypothetical protein OIV83_004395 [Microbotryomycetes sp. JL201]|nr:hypothetical protein OIV83_004395 [Microbotryomycetes sp. JL201]
MTSVEEFDRQVKDALGRGKSLSSSTVDRLTQLAMTNIKEDAHVVATLYKCHRKASPSTKLYSLYLIDAIAREARSCAKRKGKRAAADAAQSTTPPGSPRPATSGDGDEMSFLKKLDALLAKIITECWDNGKPEHRDKVKKIVDIWSRAGTFSSATLSKISSRLSAGSSHGPSATGSPADKEEGSFGSGLPASVAALISSNAGNGASSSTNVASKPSLDDEVARAVAAARGGPGNSSTAPPPPPVQPAAGPSNLSLDPTQLAFLQQMASRPQQGQHSPLGQLTGHSSAQTPWQGSGSEGPGPSSSSARQIEKRRVHFGEEIPSYERASETRSRSPDAGQQRGNSDAPPRQRRWDQPAQAEPARPHMYSGHTDINTRPPVPQRPGPAGVDEFGRAQRDGSRSPAVTRTESAGRIDQLQSPRSFSQPAHQSFPSFQPDTFHPNSQSTFQQQQPQTMPFAPSAQAQATPPPPPPPPAPAPSQTRQQALPPFNPAAFDATSPASWASFAPYLQQANNGVMPTTEQALAFCVMMTRQQQMMMMQQQQQQQQEQQMIGQGMGGGEGGGGQGQGGQDASMNMMGQMMGGQMASGSMMGGMMPFVGGQTGMPAFDQSAGEGSAHGFTPAQF